tara:strand:+ start:393 stop:1439 length:1047 start_codon:yes stop_codon:yes gene_type:complete
MTRASDTARLVSGGAVFNEASNDVDFRVEGNGEANLLVVNAGDDAVGIGTNSPSAPLEVAGGSSSNNDTANVIVASGSQHTRMIVDTSSTSGHRASYVLESNGNEVSIATTGSDEMIFSTNSAEAMRILDGSGNPGVVLVNKDQDVNTTAGVSLSRAGSGFTRASGGVVSFNRQDDDGLLVSLQQASTTEGNIVVSGSTVSYNGFSGLHESSGIPTDTPIGTVVSTIDELDVYSTKQEGLNGEEDNPKAGKARADHAKVKVSDTTGDKAVYGVVGSFNAQGKVNVASVGIGSVRVTGACAKGDLLESNGDGTAKVQSDDIVRSKTIGKVTIGNSSTDVKLVSCVLYCG